MDDFEKAVLFSFDQTGAVDAQLKAQAMSYCEQIKQSPTVWQACLEKFRFSQFPEVQFWCLQTLEETINQRYAALAQPERIFIRSSLFAAVKPDGQLSQSAHSNSAIPARPVFVKNKLAQVIVIIITLEYPSEWSSVFLDLLASLNQGPDVVDMFCRILTALDEEVISLDYPVPDNLAAASRIKDAMRQQCIPEVVRAWYSLIVTYKVQTPSLAVSVLETMSRYISWIDISLVANEVFIPLLFEYLVSANEPPQLRGAAADCLLAIVSKRMDAASKLKLLKQLQIGQVYSRIMEAQESDFALKLTSLLTGLATEVVECSKRIDVNGVSGQREAMDLVTELLDEVLPSVFHFMKHGDEEMSSTTFQFLSNYVSKMKGGDFSSNGKPAAHIRQILEVIRSRMRYDPETKDSLDVPDEEGKEEVERMAYYRKDLFGLFRNICRVAPDLACTFVQNTLAESIGKPDTPFEDVEAALMLVYVLGEGVPDCALKPVGGLVDTLLSTTLPCHSHRLVALACLETVTRYVRSMQDNPRYLPSALAAFMDARGFQHPNPNVRMRASYLFMRLVKTLRSKMVPYIEHILQNLPGTLALVTTPNPDVPSEDSSFVFEAIGVLIGMEELPLEKQSSYLSALLVPLCGQVDSILSQEPQQGEPLPATISGLQQLILAISSLSKGFGEHISTNSRPAIGGMFKQTIQVVLRVLTSFPRNKTLRSKVVSFLHRMVETLGGAMFPFLPAAIDQLLAEGDPRDIVEFLQLVNQLINRFKAAMKDIISKIYSPLMSRVFSLLPKEGFVEGPGCNTEEVRELQELHRIVFIFLHALVTNELSSVLLEPDNIRWLHETIGLLFNACCKHKDVLVRKVCVQVFTRLISDWCGMASEEEKVSGFRRFVIEQLAAECCVYSVLQTTFDLRDANTLALLGEIAATQKVLYETCRDEFLIHLATSILPSVNCPPNVAEQLCLQIQRSDVKNLKAFYRSFIEKVRPQQNGGDLPR